MSYVDFDALFWVALFVVTVLLFERLLLRRRLAHLPPGPKPLPLIGNALDAPRKHLGRECSALTQKYGDVVYLNVLGQSMVILGSLRVATDLLDKRSANYSDRPESIMVDLVGYCDWMFVLMNYGVKWRQHRRALHQVMHSEVVPDYQPIQLEAARDLLQSILHSPRGLGSHLRLSLAATVTRVTYGIDLSERDDRYFKMVERIAEVGEDIAVPGRYPVEAIPSLRFLPAWFPGGRFKRFAANAKREMDSVRDTLFDTAKTAIDQGVGKDSVITRLLYNDGNYATEDVCRGLTATMYAAAADTTHATTLAFFLAMALHPEVQKKAQAQLDSVLGPDRLPEFSDRQSLPYVRAIIKELMRWHAVTPIALPHRTVADDEYKGYLIPGGSTIFVNIWGISQDPEMYPDPEKFIPERFLDANGQLDVDGKDPGDYVFGFGRRICPGRHFAEATLFIMCASVLSTFDIRPPVDEHGASVRIQFEATTDRIVSHAAMYDYSIKPRSARAERLILEAGDGR